MRQQLTDQTRHQFQPIKKYVMSIYKCPGQPLLSLYIWGDTLEAGVFKGRVWMLSLHMVLFCFVLFLFFNIIIIFSFLFFFFLFCFSYYYFLLFFLSLLCRVTGSTMRIVRGKSIVGSLRRKDR